MEPCSAPDSHRLRSHSTLHLSLSTKIQLLQTLYFDCGEDAASQLLDVVVI